MRPDRASAFLHHGRLGGTGAPSHDPAAADEGGTVSEPDTVDPEPASRFPGAGLIGIAAAGLLLGLMATAIVLSRHWSPGTLSVGAWTASATVGTTAITPYARAELSRSGAVPMAANEGLAFTATTDDTGYRLLRSCSYRIAGVVPAARFWSLTATGADGGTLDNPAGRTGFTSRDVVRSLAGRVSIGVAPTATPGNWLPTSGDGALVLTLRLYDTPLAGNAAEVASATLPSLTRLSCGASTAGARP